MKWRASLHPRSKDGKFKPKGNNSMKPSERDALGNSLLSALARDTTSKGGKANWPKKGRR